MQTRIGINGFGRIGRNTLKIIMEKYTNELDVVVINDMADAKILAHLLKYDSIFGKYKEAVEATEDKLIINGKPIRILAEKSPEKIDWKKFGVEVVLESTGLFINRQKAEVHIVKGGVKKVLISAPAINEDITIVLGVNEDKYDNRVHNIISNASCTTNCLAPIIKVLNDRFIIVKGSMTTIHSYTNDQKLLDMPHRDLRRARAAAISIIPTKTGATKAIELVIPELADKLNGISFRIPTFCVSAVDLVIETERSVTKDMANTALKAAAEGEMKGIVKYSEEPLVSIDHKGDSASSIVDALSTMDIGGNMIKILSWYDNEWGYSNRYAELAVFISKRLDSE